MVYFKVKFLNLIDFVKNIFYYYKNIRFAVIDLSLLLYYFWKSPYRIARLEARTRHIPSLEPYGETPLSTMEIIARNCALNDHDVVYELGCGRGRTAFWLAFFCGCRVVGIDAIDVFISRAQNRVNRFHIHNVEFRTGDLLTATFEDATVLYLFQSQLTDEEIKTCFQNLCRQKKPLKVITISYWFGEYVADTSCQLLQEFEVDFPWGTTTCYLQQMIF